MFKPYAASVGATTPPAGDTYVWIGPSGGEWDDAANWQDTTTGTTGRSVPGANAYVDVTGIVEGGGTAESLTDSGYAFLLGDYQFGRVEVTSFGTLELGGATGGSPTVVHTTNLQVDARSTLAVTNAQLYVSLLAATSFVTVTDGASVQAGSVTLDAVGGILSSGGQIVVDSTSTFEIGNAGHARAGFLTVDAGASLTGTGGVSSPVINDGTIIADGMSLGAVRGAGLLEIGARSDLFLTGFVSGQIIDFTGLGGQLVLDYMVGPLTEGFGLAAGTAIAGFVPGEFISITNGAVAFRAVATSGGEELTLLASDGRRQRLDLLGVTDATRFLLVQDGGTLLVSVPVDAGHGNAPAGTAAAESYVWTGDAGSDWAATGNWQDARGGAVAVAPGRRDNVTLDPAYTPSLITGTGVAHGFTLEAPPGGLAASAILVGRFAFHILAGYGSLIEAGRSTRITVGYAHAGEMLIEDGVFRAGSVTGGGWMLTGSAFVQVAEARLVSVGHIDATSTFEIGTLGHAAAGKLTVDAGVLVAGPCAFEVDVVDNGTISTGGTSEPAGLGSTLVVSGSLSGSGVVLIDPYGEASVGSIGSGVTIDFVGQAGTLALAALPSGVVSLADFRPGDLLTLPDPAFLNGSPLPQATFSGNAQGGTLSLFTVSSAGTAEAQYRLSGDYVGDTFLVTGSYETVGVLVLPAVPASTQAPPGTTTPETFMLRGNTSGGSWDDPASWEVGGATSTVAPGALDNVVIFYGDDLSPRILFGVGTADTISGDASLVLDGRFSANAMTINSLQLVSGTTLTLRALAAGSFTTQPVIVNQSTVSVCGMASINGAELTNGSSMAVGTLSFNGAVTVASEATFTVGNAAGGSATGTIEVRADGTIAGSGGLDGPVQDDGLIVAYGLTMTGTVTGTGTLELQEGRLELDASVASTISVAFAGIDTFLSLVDARDMLATVSGFAASDTIDVTGFHRAVAAQYQFLGNDLGRVALTDSAGSTLDVLSLAGDYRGATFTLAQTAEGVALALQGAATHLG